MRNSRLWIFRFALALFLSSAQHFIHAQNGIAKPDSMKGMLIEQPERLSGVWEAAIGSGGVVGLHFILTTKIAGASATLGDVPQYQEDLTIGVYQRSGKVLAQNYFADATDEGVLWDGKRLILRWEPRSTDEAAIDLNLRYDDEHQTWIGLFHRGGFSGNVTLRRPAANLSDPVSRLIGTWVSLQPGMNGCVHIGQGPDGTLEGWSDDLRMSGRLGANGLNSPEQTVERYGDLVRVTQTDRDMFSIEFKAYAPMCCSHTFAGSISADDSTLTGSWQAGRNQSPVKSAWKKAQKDSCR